MFAKTTTRTKIITGFSTAIAISLLVGWIGYRAIGSLSSQVYEVGSVRLASLAAIKEIEVALEQIKAAQRTLLNLDVDHATRIRQYEMVARAKAAYENAWSSYEALPKNPQEADLWRQFVPAWKQWVSGFQRVSSHVARARPASRGTQWKGLCRHGQVSRRNSRCRRYRARAEVALKSQVQEWKNILIRGNNPADYDKHLKAFESNEKDVQADLAQLKEIMPKIGLDPRAAAERNPLSRRTRLEIPRGPEELRHRQRPGRQDDRQAGSWHGSPPRQGPRCACSTNRRREPAGPRLYVRNSTTLL